MITTVLSTKWYEMTGWIIVCCLLHIPHIVEVEVHLDVVVVLGGATDEVHVVVAILRW